MGPAGILRWLLAALLAVSAVPALADKLAFDHRLYPPLYAVFESGDADMINFNDKNSAYVVDLVVVRGKSTRNWTEAMVIIARSPDKRVRTAAGWVEELKAQAQAECASTFEIITQDENSITFIRRSQGCRSGYPATAIYRVVQGSTSLFLLGAMSKDGFTPDSQRGWLALLASARLE